MVIINRMIRSHKAHLPTHLTRVIDPTTVMTQLGWCNLVQVILHITMTRVTVNLMLQIPITVGQTLRHMDTTRINMDMLHPVGPINMYLLAVITIPSRVVVAMHTAVPPIINISRLQAGSLMGIRVAGEARSALNLAVATNFQH